MAYKKYSYYNKGNKIAIVESETGSAGGNTGVAHCTIGTHTNKADCEAAGGTWIPSTSGSSSGNWEKYISPKESITDGLEIEYSYAPIYNIEDASDTKLIGGYEEENGLLKLTLASSSHTKDDWVYIEGSNIISGLHQVNATTSSSVNLVLNTKYNGSAVTETSTLYQDVTYIQDESFDLDLTDYQAQAVVYYLKAKMSEDARDMEGREYFLRLFRKQMEKSSAARKKGPYRVQGFWGMRK